jgi:ActR/RegA family two-component response regulator
MSIVTRVLVVDRDRAVVEALTREVGRHTRDVEVAVAGDLAEAERDRALRDVGAIVVEVGLLDGAGIAALTTLRARSPGLPVILAAAGCDADVARLAVQVEASGLVAKPYDVARLLGVLEAPVQDAGFVGECSGVPTALLLSLHCGLEQDGALLVSRVDAAGRPLTTGLLSLEGGALVHAAAEGKVGASAVHEVLSWRQARARWVPGRVPTARTIVGRWEGVLAVEGRAVAADAGNLALEHPELVEKVSRLAQTPELLATYLLRHGEIVIGTARAPLADGEVARAIRSVARVAHDLAHHSETQQEVQTLIGDLRLVVDRVGPPECGFQVGVVVRQAAVICKSLRRLLRQIDRAFAREMLRSPRLLPERGALHEVA